MNPHWGQLTYINHRNTVAFRECRGLNLEQELALKSSHPVALHVAPQLFTWCYSQSAGYMGR